jgi:GYF domain 2
MEEYYFSDGEKQFGPFTLGELKDQKITKDSLIWYEGLDNWIKANEIENLKTLFKATPPPLQRIQTPKVEIPVIQPPIKSFNDTFKNQPFDVEQEVRNELKSSKQKLDNVAKYILGIFGFIILCFIIYRYGYNSKSDSVIETQQAINQAVEETKVQTRAETEQSIANQQQQEANQEIALQNERQEIISALNKVKEEVANVCWGGLGGASDIQIKMNNPTKLSFKYIKVEVSYVKESGELHKIEEVIFYDVIPYSSQLENAPNSDRGVRLRTKIIDFESSDVPSDLQ